MKAGKFLLPIIILIAATIYFSVFIVKEVNQAIVLQFGDPKRIISKPGINFKIPFIQNVVFLDKRILNLDTPPEEVIASDQKRLIVDVRIKRADLPQANSDAIFRRMQTEREREAKEFRAKGAEMAVTITSTADKEVTVILADAQKKSEIMKGEGDGMKNKIFADAFGQDPEFFAFYRAMQAYQKALIGGETSMILSPDSEFFKFFGNIDQKVE